MRLLFRLCGTSTFVTQTGDCPDVSGDGKQPACCARQCLPTSDCFISGKLARTTAANGDLRQGTDCMTQRHAATWVTLRIPILRSKDEKGLREAACANVLVSFLIYIYAPYMRGGEADTAY
jgi:hypothetical protein